MRTISTTTKTTELGTYTIVFTKNAEAVYQVRWEWTKGDKHYEGASEFEFWDEADEYVDETARVLNKKIA